MEETEPTEQERGITFGEIFRRIWKRKWIVIGVTVAVTLIAALLFAFVVNPLVASYTISFELVYPAREDLKYPDGSPFYYQDIVSRESLERVKASDGRFGGIDVAKMAEEQDAVIKAETVEADGAGKYTGKYTLTVKMSYFKNGKIGNDFVKAVASMPEMLVKEKAASIDYTLDKTVFDDSSFQSRLALLASQKEAIVDQYDAWIADIGNSYRIEGKTLLSYRASAATLFDKKTQESLTRDLEQGGYVPVDEIAAERKSLKEEYEINEKKIAELKKALGVETVSLVSVMPVAAATQTPEENGPTIIFPEEDPDLSQTLASLITRNENIRHQLGDGLNAEDLAQGALNSTNVGAYAARVEEQYTLLKNAADTLRTVSTTLYETETDTRFETANVGKDGSTSLILVTVAAFVIALLVVCVAVYAADVSKEKKRAALSPQESEPPQGSEPPQSAE